MCVSRRDLQTTCQDCSVVTIRHINLQSMYSVHRSLRKGINAKGLINQTQSFPFFITSQKMKQLGALHFKIGRQQGARCGLNGSAESTQCQRLASHHACTIHVIIAGTVKPEVWMYNSWVISSGEPFFITYTHTLIIIHISTHTHTHGCTQKSN